MTGPGIGNEAISDKDARARYAREFVAAATVKELQQAMASADSLPGILSKHT